MEPYGENACNLPERPVEGDVVNMATYSIFIESQHLQENKTNANIHWEGGAAAKAKRRFMFQVFWHKARQK